MKHIRNSRLSRIVACYLAIQLIVSTIQPANLYALTGGPAQPEFNSFTPIGTSDMVSLTSGDFNYNIPIMDVGGYPLNLAYNSGVSMDQEASWVGLGWDLSVGQINRQVRGIPDDFDGTKGDNMVYKNSMKDNETYGANIEAHPAVAGWDIGLNIASLKLGIEYNTYNGFVFKPNLGVSFNMASGNSVDFNFATSTTGGVDVTPRFTMASVTGKKNEKERNVKGSYGLSINSREGVEGIAIDVPIMRSFRDKVSKKFTTVDVDGNETTDFSLVSGTSTFSYAGDTYTPKKRTPYLNTNYAFNTALGVEVFFAEGQGEVYAYGYLQKMLDKTSVDKVFGYENTEKATMYDILDFNRENDRTVGKYTSTLAIPNYTYDVYGISGQGVSGEFRPYRSQVGFIFDKYIQDKSKNTALGVEVGSGGIVHLAADFKYQPSRSSTGLWVDNNKALSGFTEQTKGNPLDYEKVYFKNTNEIGADTELDRLLNGHLGSNEPIRIPLKGGWFNKRTIYGKYLKGEYNLNTNEEIFKEKFTTPFSKIKRTNRLVRNQAIQKLTTKELKALTRDYNTKPKIHPKAKSHHTAAIHVTKKDGSKYHYDQPVYNTKKIEASFNVGANKGVNGLVTYAAGNNSEENKRGNSHFFTKTETPAYAHTFLISSVLSSDYQDITGNGPTDDDLGAYTKFIYKTPETDYKWRVPVQKQSATYNPGLYSLSEENESDDTGSYLYGTKELMYIDEIVTKTHIAKFYTSARKDAKGVSDENGGVGSGRMRKLDKIELFTRSEYGKVGAKPIKTAHFDYSYTLCAKSPNGDGVAGKLTLDKVYFTYRGSNMGKYTPYKFSYTKKYKNASNNTTLDNNPAYNVSEYNMWGGYKREIGKNGKNGETSNSEYPYINQDDNNELYNEIDDKGNVVADGLPKTKQDIEAASWSISKIDLPSAGSINVDYESDDYQFVQDKKALQMYKVFGVGARPVFSENKKLYRNSQENEARYLYIKVKSKESLNAASFRERYIGDLIDKKIYFRFLLNMIKNTNSQKYDFVTGYLDLNNNEDFVVAPTEVPNEYNVAVPIELVNMEGGINGGRNVNPISKAGWFFGRANLNRLVHGQGKSNNKDVVGFVGDIISQVKTLSSIFKGPNGYLRSKQCASTFIPKKSWIRLQNGIGKKLGGGVRVKRIKMSDNWDKMTGNKDNIYYKMDYGQEYNYKNVDGTSSGVAAFEPMSSKENPFVIPIDDGDKNKGKLLAIPDRNYIEGPLGASFFPSPQVTYARVEVQNLSRKNEVDPSKIIKRHATGKVVTEHFTTKDFPTIAKNTKLEASYKEAGTGLVGAGLGQLGLNIYIDRHLAMSQGFSVELNDMNGKTKNQRVYPEGAEKDGEAISGVDYIYKTKNGKLDNTLIAYDEKGKVTKQTMGVSYDVVNDFRTSKSSMQSYGGDLNLAIAAIPFPIGSVTLSNISFATQRSKMRSAATVKIIHKKGLLEKTIAYDLGAKVSTTNLAYDKYTGNVLLTEASNEYGEHYYNLNYPAYWGYEGMGHSSKNMGITIGVKHLVDNQYNTTTSIPKNTIKPGDKVLVKLEGGEYYSAYVWVSSVSSSQKITLINDKGKKLEIADAVSFKIMESAFKNMQSASMGSVTCMKNPLANSNGIYNDFTGETLTSTNWNDYRVINTSGVEYQDKWSSQCEFRLPNVIYDEKEKAYKKSPKDLEVNLFVYNLENSWKAKRSYAYLTGRYNGPNGQDPNPRNSGFLIKHKPFYTVDAAGKWTPTIGDEAHKWTFASEVTQFSSFGAEIENKDALNRYSSAQYGYRYTLPTAVASNTKYSQLAFDGFEDYDYIPLSGSSEDKINPHFGFHDVEKENPKANLSQAEAHSGRSSIEIASNSSAELSFVLSCDVAKPDAIRDIYRDEVCDINGATFDIDVLKNDINAKDVKISIETEPENENATVTVIDDKVIRYTYTGPPLNDSFMYKICNKNNVCDTAEVVVFCINGDEGIMKNKKK